MSLLRFFFAPSSLLAKHAASSLDGEKDYQIIIFLCIYVTIIQCITTACDAGPLKWEFIFLSRYHCVCPRWLICGYNNNNNNNNIRIIRQVGGGGLGGKRGKMQTDVSPFRCTLGEFKLEVLKGSRRNLLLFGWSVNFLFRPPDYLNIDRSIDRLSAALKYVHTHTRALKSTHTLTYTVAFTEYRYIYIYNMYTFREWRRHRSTRQSIGFSTVAATVADE